MKVDAHHVVFIDQFVIFGFRSARGSSERALQIILLDSASIQVNLNQKHIIQGGSMRQWLQSPGIGARLPGAMSTLDPGQVT